VTKNVSEKIDRNVSAKYKLNYKVMYLTKIETCTDWYPTCGKLNVFSFWTNFWFPFDSACSQLKAGKR